MRPYFRKPGIWDNGVWCLFDKLCPRASPPVNSRPIARFALEIASFVCDRATHTENEKLRPKGIAMYAYSVSAYYSYTGSQLIRPVRSRSKRTQSRTSSRASSMPKRLKTWVNVRLDNPLARILSNPHSNGLRARQLHRLGRSRSQKVKAYFALVTYA